MDLKERKWRRRSWNLDFIETQKKERVHEWFLTMEIIIKIRVCDIFSSIRLSFQFYIVEITQLVLGHKQGTQKLFISTTCTDQQSHTHI